MISAFEYFRQVNRQCSLELAGDFGQYRCKNDVLEDPLLLVDRLAYISTYSEDTISMYGYSKLPERFSRYLSSCDHGSNGNISNTCFVYLLCVLLHYQKV